MTEQAIGSKRIRKEYFRHSAIYGVKNYPAEYMALIDAGYRCNNPKNKFYHRYGLRGIEVRYKDLQDLINDIGRRPDGDYSLDRIDNDGHYEKGNCRWATPKQQQGNRHDNVWIEYNGTRKILIDWANDLNIGQDVISVRLRDSRWTIGQALGFEPRPVIKRNIKRRKLTPNIIKEIMDLKGSMHYLDVAKKYKVAFGGVYDIWRGVIR